VRVASGARWRLAGAVLAQFLEFGGGEPAGEEPGAGDDEGVEPEMGEVRAFFPKREEIPWWATDLSRGHFSGWRSKHRDTPGRGQDLFAWA
jgi:hypothetical protein